MKRLFKLSLGLILAGFFLGGCQSQKATKNQTLTVVTSLRVYSEMAQEILGTHGQATSIIDNASIEPHAYEATVKDAKKIAAADVVVANGLGYDDWLLKSAKANQNPQQKQVNIAKLANKKSGANEHFWFDLKTMILLSRHYKTLFSQIKPEFKADFVKNQAKYEKKLKVLQQKEKTIQQKTAQMNVVVSEPVFDNALTDMGFTIKNPAFAKAIEEGNDPSPQAIIDLKKQLKAHEIAFAIINEQSSGTAVKQLEKWCQAEDIKQIKVTETPPNNTTYLQWVTELLTKVKGAIS